MSLVEFDLDQDIAEVSVENKTSYQITTLSAAQANNINGFVAENTSTAFLSNAQGDTTTIPLSSAFRHIGNYYFSSTGNTIPVAHDNTSTTGLLRSIQIGRTIADDSILSGSITAVFAFGSSGNNTYIDVAESTITGSVGRKGALVSQSNTANVVGTVFYESATLVFHGGTGWPQFLVESASGMTFGAASAGKIVCTSLSFQSVNKLKKTLFFCRAFNKQFNYTNNPSAISNAVDGTITSSLTANPRTFITTVALYNDDNDILAVGKVSTPIKKSFEDEVNLAVAIQY